MPRPVRKADWERVDRVRHNSNDVQNHVIDEFFAARLTRADFLRRATIAGLSIPSVSMLIAACGGSESGGGTANTGSGATGSYVNPPGGTLRVGVTSPGRRIDPLVMGDAGSNGLVTQVGEYLSFNGGGKELVPVLAESWESNDDASVWTFKIRSGVKFNDGTPMTAEDVAATFNRLSDPANGTNALEILQGVLSPGGARATDETTVVFELDGPNGNFPWISSSDNSSSVILPKSYDGDWDKTWIGTGPWVLDSYRPKVSATFVRNPDYWGEATVADRVEFTLYEDELAMVLGLQSGDVDMISGFGAANGQALLADTASYTVNELPSAAHRPWHFRTDKEPLDDKRVRQALALCLNRQELVDSLLDGYGDLGNDSPFAPVFAATNPDVPQREQDIEKAKRLMAEAGKQDGFELQVNVWDWATNPDFAQIMQQAVAEIGVKVNLVVQDTATYLGTGEFGSSPQLDSISGVGDWGARGVADAFLTAQLMPDGVRNAAHWKNDRFAQLFQQYRAESDIQSQRQIAGEMQELLLDETPVVYPFFISYLTADRTGFGGARPSAMGAMLVDRAGATEA